jgi:flagellar protein FliO/FliZ
MKSFTLTRGVVLSGALTLLHAPVALAASANSFENTPVHLSATSATTHASSAGSGGSIVRTVVGLAIVIAVIYGLTWIMRQAKQSKNPAKGVGLEQVASLPLGTNRSVSLVRVGNELHLLGVAEHSVTMIRTFTEDEAIEAGFPVAPPGERYEDGDGDSQPPIIRFVDSLRKFTAR